MQSNIKKDYIWNTVGAFLQNAISPLLLIIITRVNGIEDSGLFSFAFSIAVVLWMLGIWGGRTYQVSDEKREFSHRSYVMVRLVLALVMLMGAIIFCVVNNYDAVKTGLIVALVFFKAIESIADALHGILQVNGKLYVAGKALMYKAAAGFMAFVVIDIFTHDIFLASGGLILVTLGITVLYDLRLAQAFDPVTITYKQIPKAVHAAITIMKRTWPVFIVLFLTLFSLNIPRYFVDMYHQADIGYFGIIAMPITLIVLLMTFILQPNVVVLSKLFASKKYEAFGHTVRKLLLLTTGLGIATLVATELIGVWALDLVFGIPFTDYKTALLLMVIGGLLNALVVIFINIFTIMRRFKHTFYALLLTNILLVAVAGQFIKEHGITGSAFLFAVVCFTQTGVLFISYLIVLADLKRRSGR